MEACFWIATESKEFCSFFLDAWNKLCLSVRNIEPLRGGRFAICLEGYMMLGWALTFLVLALIAALFGFGGIAANAAGIAQILFFLFIVLFLASLIANAIRGRPIS